MLGLTFKLLAQFRILRRNTDRARVEVTFTHHDAAERNQRRGSEAKFFGTQQCGDCDVAAGF